jgi:hypothetical protein
LLSQRGISSVGRALAWHARGQRFDPAILHKGLLGKAPFFYDDMFPKNNIFNCQISDLSNTCIITNISHMKRNLLLATIFLYLISFGISSCSSNNTAGGQVNPNSVGTPFTLKYEIIASSPFNPPVTGLPGNSIVYRNGTGQTGQDNNFSGTTWTKEITVTTTNRPFISSLGTTLYFNVPGTMTGKIYVNGNLVANVQNPTQGGGSTYISTIGMSYLVN